MRGAVIDLDPDLDLSVASTATADVGALDLACAIGALTPEPARRAQALAVRVKRMLRALLTARAA